LGKLPVCGSAGKIRKAQGGRKHDKGENNDECSAFRCATIRIKELFHGVKTFTGLEGLLGEIKITSAQPNTLLWSYQSLWEAYEAKSS
jgi:hypothetical protein